MASDSIHFQKARHRRIEILLQVGCAKYVRAMIMKYVNDFTTLNLDEFLRRNIHDNGYFNQDEWDLLDPRNGKSNIKNWDLALLINVYIGHCNPSKEEEMDLHTLRKRRNKLICHSTTCRLNKHTYKKCLDEIEVISTRRLNSLNDQTLTDEVNAILYNDEEFARLTELMNELELMLQQNIDDKETSQKRELLSQIFDILKQLYPEGCAVNIPDIKLKLVVKNCGKEKERFICEKVMEYMKAELKDNYSDKIKQAVNQSIMKLIKHDVKIVSAENKCVIITLRCHSVRGLSNLWLEYTKDSVDIFEPLQSYLRMVEGYENVQVESEILESDIWECVHTIVGNMFNKQEDATESDIAECTARESTVSESRITSIPYTISHDGNDTFVKIDAKVDSFHHMKHILDVCESGTINNSLENIATALKENLSLEDLSIEINVDANATLEQLKERYSIVKPEEPNEDIVDDSASQNIRSGEDISVENETGRFNRNVYRKRMQMFGNESERNPLVTPEEPYYAVLEMDVKQLHSVEDERGRLYSERMQIFGFESAFSDFLIADKHSETSPGPRRHSRHEYSDVHSNCSSISICSK